MTSHQNDGPEGATTSQRLDQALVGRGLARSRSHAADLVRRGFVSVDGRIATKPGETVRQGSDIKLADRAPDFVGRGAEKLVAGLDAFGFSCDGRVAIDVGASTGGFTEVLLRRGARRVFSVDVGQGQLDASLRADLRVVQLEKTDARALDGTLIPEAVDAIVADVSFISLRKALPAALALAGPGSWLVALVKPQFEVGREGIGKGGVVRSAELQDRAVEGIVDWLRGEMGWRIAGVVPSPIMGGDGNREFLIGALL